jgi:SdpC family antimicrobial peptide
VWDARLSVDLDLPKTATDDQHKAIQEASKQSGENMNTSRRTHPKGTGTMVIKQGAATFVLVVTAMAMIVSSAVGASAEAGVGNTHAAGASRDAVAKYSDTELLLWLIAATGPVATEHPETLSMLGVTSENRPPVIQPALDNTVAAYLAYDRSFHADIAAPILSGDPIRTEQALKVFVGRSKSFMAKSSSKTLSTQSAASSATAAGKAGAKAKVAVYVVALANAVVYANVAVATNVAATLVLAWFYLMDDSMTSAIDRQEYVAGVARAFGR